MASQWLHRSTADTTAVQRAGPPQRNEQNSTLASRIKRKATKEQDEKQEALFDALENRFLIRCKTLKVITGVGGVPLSQFIKR